MTHDRIARKLAADPDFPKPIRDDQPHPGWQDGVYRDDAGIRWVRTSAVFEKNAWLPDLDDAATKGVLLDLVRTRHKDPTISAHRAYRAATWFVAPSSLGPFMPLARAPHEGAALALAFLQPRPTG